MVDIDQYILSMPESRQSRARALHRRVRRLFPQARFSLRMRMPTYEVGDNVLAWGNKKSYFSVYTCSAERIAAFKAKYPEVPSGIGCLNFRDRDPFPLRDLERVIKSALTPSARILLRERQAVVSARKSRRHRRGAA